MSDLDLTDIKKAIADMAAHQHGREDWYCLNLVGWLGERARFLVEEIERLREERDAYSSTGYWLHKTCGSADAYHAKPVHCTTCKDVDHAWWPLYTWDAPESAPVGGDPR